VQSRNEYFYQLFSELQKQCKDKVAGHLGHSEESNEQLLNDLDTLLKQFGQKTDYVDLGGDILQRIISHYPDITPLMHRDLLWFCGGQCLHYLGDEELERYQLIEERYFQAEAANYREIRAQAFGMH
jgi:hypothetical protein